MSRFLLLLLILAAAGCGGRSPSESGDSRAVSVDAESLRVLSSGDGHDWLALSDKQRLELGFECQRRLNPNIEPFDYLRFASDFYLAAQQRGDETQMRRRVSEVVAIATVLSEQRE